MPSLTTQRGLTEPALTRQKRQRDDSDKSALRRDINTLKKTCAQLGS